MGWGMVGRAWAPLVRPHPGPVPKARASFEPTLGDHRSLRNSSGDREPLLGSSASPRDPEPPPGMEELPLARDSPPSPQLYFRPRRGEKAISQEALTSMLEMGDSPSPATCHSRPRCLARLSQLFPHSGDILETSCRI